VYPLVALAMLLTVTGVLNWQGVPGLPFIALGFLSANTRSFRFSREEWKALAVVCAVLLALAVGMLVLWHATS